MFSHPARQNNSFRHSVDTNGIALTCKVGIHPEFRACLSLIVLFRTTVTSKSVTTDTPSSKIPYQLNDERPVPAHHPENLGIPRFSLLESRSLSAERRESETKRNRFRPLASIRKRCLSGKRGCCVLVQVRTKSH